MRQPERTQHAPCATLGAAPQRGRAPHPGGRPPVQGPPLPRGRADGTGEPWLPARRGAGGAPATRPRPDLRHALAAVLALLLVPHAVAVDEADARRVDPEIAEVGHIPEVPQPGTQWEGFIRFEPGHNVTDVQYQICKVGIACFAPPTPAQRMDDDTWRFDTNDYRTGGSVVAWGINHPGDPVEDTWRVGVQYLIYRDGAEPVFENAELLPEGLDPDSQACAEVGHLACQETHYFAFDMPARSVGREAAPGPAWVGLAALALAGGVRWRRR